MTRRVLVAAHTLLVVSSVSAETIQERGKRVVMEALEALGGDKFLAMKDRVESGRAYSFYREELSGLSVARVYTQYIKPAAAGVIAVRERQSFGKGEETSAVLFTGEAAYQITFRGARPVPDDTLQRYKDGVLHNVFYILRQRLNETGLIFESAGSDVWQNQPVEIVDITDSENRVVTVSFHRSLKVPLRQLFYRRDPKTRDRIEEITAFSKYRDVGGVQWPYAIRRERDGEKIYEMFSENVQINQGLADSMFTLPGNVKILKKPD
jgi:hypothetical protein